MFEEENAQWGLVHALVLDGKGGARSIARTELDQLQLQPQESLWLHWDRSHPQTQTWLRKASGLSEFACDLLLEENTRPRLLPLPDAEDDAVFVVLLLAIALFALLFFCVFLLSPPSAPLPPSPLPSGLLLDCPI